MTDVTHKVLVKFEADTKGVEAGTRSIAKEANKLSKQQKLEFGQGLKRQKETAKVAGPQQQRQQTVELRKQNQEHRTTNRLLQQMAAGWQRVASAAKSAWKSTAGGPAGAGGGGRRPPSRSGSTGFGAGFNAGLGPGPNFSRYGLGHGLATGARAGIGLAGGGLAALATMPFAAVSSDYQAHFTNQRAMGGLAGLNKGARFGAGLTVGNVKGMQGDMANKLGYAPDETIQAAKLFGRSTGSNQFTERGMTAAKVTGLDTSTVSSMFDTIRQGGGGFGEKGMKDFQKILQAAVKGGVDASTLPEYFEGIQSLTGRASAGAGGAVSALPYAQILAMFEKSGAAGLKGARGAAVASSLEDGFKTPGGGEEGLAVIMGSLGFGRAGGNVDYYSAKKAQEQGFSEPGGGNNLKNLFDYVDKINGGSEKESNLYMEGLMGNRLTLDQIETVRGALKNGKSSQQIEQMLADMTATELDVLHSIDANMRAFLGAAKLSAKVQIDDIARGAEYADPLESIQAMFHEFLHTMMPVVKFTLEGINVALGFILGGVNKLVETFTRTGDIDEALIGSDTVREQGRAVGTAREDTARVIAAGWDNATQEDLARVIANSQTAYNGTTAVTGEDTMLNGLVGGIDTITGGAVSDAATAQLQQDFRNAVQALDLFAERIGRGNEVDPGMIHNGAELTRAMTALGMAIPAGPRSQLDSTGGSP